MSEILKGIQAEIKHTEEAIEKLAVELKQLKQQERFWANREGVAVPTNGTKTRKTRARPLFHLTPLVVKILTRSKDPLSVGEIFLKTKRSLAGTEHKFATLAKGKIAVYNVINRGKAKGVFVSVSRGLYGIAGREYKQS